MKFLHAADIHLDSPLAGIARRGEGAASAAVKDCTRHAFSDMIDLAISEDVAFILIAGDLYDADWRDYSTGLFFAGEMKRLNRRCFIVRGNHDAHSVITRTLRTPPNVHVLSSRTCESVRLDDLDVVIHGRSFPDRAVPEDLAATYPPAIPGMLNIGLLHTSAEGSSDHDTYAPCTVSTLLSKGYEYWALGHIHTREILHEAPWIVFPGNLQGRSPRETGPRGCMIVETEERRIVAVEHRVVDVLRWANLRIDVSGVSDMTLLTDQILHALRGAADEADSRPLLARVILTGTTKLHGGLLADPAKIDAECRSAALTASDQLWIESVQVRTASADTHAANQVAAGGLAALYGSFRAVLDDPSVRDPLLNEFQSILSRLPAAAADGDLRIPRDEATLNQLSLDAWEIVVQSLGWGQTP